MATSGKYVASWQDGGVAYLSVRVTEAGGDVEYIGSVPVEDLADLSPAERRAALIAAVKAVRDRQVSGLVAITGFPATVTL